MKHMKLCRAKGSLIVPVWKSAHFWALICSDGVPRSNFIHDWVTLPNFPNLFIVCKALISIFGCMPLSFLSVALCIDVSIPFSVGFESSQVTFIVPGEFWASSAIFFCEFIFC